jgi:membrane fusion protein (multidrug efflux system)
LKVKYAVSQTHAASIKLQQRVSVTSEVFPQQTFIGSVIFISPTVDANTGTIAIQAQIANQQHQLSPGMFVRIKQFLGSNRSSLVIPANALVASQQGTKVFKVVAGEAKEIPVQVGLRQQGLVEITKGLALGDQVVISGVQKLTDGSLVKIIKYHSPDVSSGLANQQISLDQPAADKNAASHDNHN